MGIAAGGRIDQKIYEDERSPYKNKRSLYEDNRSPYAYDEDAAERVWIHTVSTAAWEVSWCVECCQ
jgi:hypothetical protein